MRLLSIVLLVFLSWVLASTAYAQDDDVQTEQTEEESNEEKAAEVRSDPETFRPTEEVAADTAVAFPSDI